MKSKLALLIAAALLTTVATARAQEHESRQAKSSPAKSSSVRLGEKVILIPDPEGFEEGTSQFESFKRRVEVAEAPQNDMLLAHLPVSDCELVRKGLTATYDHYTKVSVMRASREVAISRAEMKAALANFRGQMGTYLDPNGPAMKALEKHLERGLTNLDEKETNVDFSKPQLLGEFDVRPDVNSYLMLMTITLSAGGTEQSLPMLVTTSFVHVKDRVIFVYSYKKYRSQADIDAIKQFATKWTTSILAANQ